MANFLPRILYNAITITYLTPLEDDPFGEKIKATNVTTTSGSGLQQNNQLYQEEHLKLKFTFVSKALADATRTFFKDWGSRKKVFTFYPHGDVSTDSADYILEDDVFEPKRILPGASSDFLYQFELNLSRVL